MYYYSLPEYVSKETIQPSGFYRHGFNCLHNMIRNFLDLLWHYLFSFSRITSPRVLFF